MKPSAVAAPVSQTLTRIGKAIRDMELPAVEKISEEQAGTPFHVLISTMLSAQTRDAVTLEASTRLFKRAPTPKAMLKLSTAEIEKLIYPVSFYRNKAIHVQQTCEILLERFDGRVPDTMEELLTLPGVGRKTANVVLGNAFGKPGITVDTHFGRLARRFGWSTETDPVKVEHEVGALIPKSEWTMLSHRLIWHGRRICFARRPACGACPLATLCPAFGEGEIDPVRARKMVKAAPDGGA
jgi:endonuclease-3